MVAQQVQERLEVMERRYQQELAAREQVWCEREAEVQCQEAAWLQCSKEAQAHQATLQAEVEVLKSQLAHSR